MVEYDLSLAPSGCACCTKRIHFTRLAHMGYVAVGMLPRFNARHE